MEGSCLLPVSAVVAAIGRKHEDGNVSNEP
jgi:hypothetical protein